MTIRKGKTIIAGNSSNGLEIGDIGLSAIGIDESLNYRRYLNGQEILQAQFPEFTKKIKRRVELYPSLACTNIEYETACTLSTHGQCGKFVIDNERGVIRLPKVVNVMGLSDMAEAGVTVDAGLPNIKQDYTGLNGVCGNGDAVGIDEFLKPTGYDNGWAVFVGTDSNYTRIYNYQVDASLSNPIYGNSETVQQEAIKYPYFIQVASSCETTINLTRDIELNNPFSLFEYKFSEYAIDNISWLESKGQWNSNKVYVSAYEELLAIYNGKVREGVSVKKTTETYTDYDFVIDEAGSTFRLPIRVKGASGNLITSLSDVEALNDISDWTVQNRKTSTGEWNDTSLGYDVQPSQTGAFTLNTSDSDLKLYFYVGETVQDGNLINAGAVLEDVNTLKNTALTNNQITNCITEIPQRIKLELNAEKSLVLKAGSEYIIPNGFEEDGVTPKFEYITADIDIQQANGHATQDVYCVRNYTSPKYLAGFHATKGFSGDTAPTGFGTYAFWYDTANNLVKWTQDSGSTWTAGYSLPICLATGTETGNVNMASIDQVFNGIGYIGSTVWVDKGVKGLIPNGRNADGSLNNTEVITQNVVTKQVGTNDYKATLALYADGTINATNSYYTKYDSTNNFLYTSSAQLKSMSFGSVDVVSGGITNFKTKLPLRVIDHSDKPEVSGWSAPSSKRSSLTVGSVGTTYVAPANGWVELSLNNTSNYFAVNILDSSSNLKCSCCVAKSTSNGYQAGVVPVKRGDIIKISLVNSSPALTFIYADGEV